MADNDNFPKTEAELTLMTDLVDVCRDSSVDLVKQLVTLLAVARSIAVFETGDWKAGHTLVRQTLDQLEALTEIPELELQAMVDKLPPDPDA